MASPAKTQQVLEINLISAQGLKPPSSSPRRRLQTYALTWIDSSTKLRTRVDKVGGTNPTWNDKFLFRVTPDFLASDISGVSVAIYAVGTFRDHLIGTVRVLVSNIISSSDSDTDRTPCFSAFQIRRPSGRFYGVMNIGAMLIEASDFPALNKISAIGYRDLMGEKIHHCRRKTPLSEPKSKFADGGSGSSESCENSCAESVDGADSSTSSPRTTTLKDWNGVRELAGSGFLCCLVAHRNIQHISPSSPTIER